MRKPMKGFIMNVETGVRRPFPFNPTPLEESRMNEFVDMKSPGLNSPYFQYTGGEANVHTFTMYVNDKAKGQTFGSTFDMLNFLRQFKPDSNEQFNPPPPIMIAYGTGNKVILGIVENMDIKRERFSPDTLLPVSAEIQLTIKELPPEGMDLESQRARLGRAWY